MKSVILCYVPVLHQGYLDFFQRHAKAGELWLIGSDFLSEHRPIAKDLRALNPEEMKTIVESLGLFEEVKILNRENISAFQKEEVQIISPHELVTEAIVTEFFSNDEVEWESVFLRWDKSKSLTQMNVEPDVTISQGSFDKDMMSLAYEEAKKSSDWWRQTGAVLVKDGKVISVVRNTHVPQDMQQYSDGDPRADFRKGEHLDISTALHSEAAAIAEAARKGISTDGCWLYATTFPCPYCAPIVAASGIKKLYYTEGYSLVDGERVLKAKGVEIIKVAR